MGVRDWLKRTPMARVSYEGHPSLVCSNGYAYRGDEGSVDLMYFIERSMTERSPDIFVADLIYGGDHYFSFFHEMFSSLEDESTVVLLTRALRPLNRTELKGLKERNPDRSTLVVDSSLDIGDEKQIFLRRRGNSLTALTEEQEQILKEKEKS